MIQRLFADTRSSILFLSRLPVSYSTQSNLPEFNYSARCFAFAGLIIAIPAALILWITFSTGLPVPAVAIMAVTTMIIVTGALHEDGLADMIDGFWGGHTKQRKLEIMRDSAIGIYGTLGLILTILLRVILYAHLIDHYGGVAGAIVLIANASLSRAAMLQPWALLSPARPSADDDNSASEGQKHVSSLSARYGMPTRTTMIWGTLAALPALILLIWACGTLSALSGLVGLQICVLIMIHLSKAHIEGHSGDTLGATQQLSELGLLLGLVWTM